MKISKGKLRKIIREEVRRLTEMQGMVWAWDEIAGNWQEQRGDFQDPSYRMVQSHMGGKVKEYRTGRGQVAVTVDVEGLQAAKELAAEALPGFRRQIMAG